MNLYGILACLAATIIMVGCGADTLLAPSSEPAAQPAAKQASMTPEQARAEIDRREISYEGGAFLLYAQLGNLEVVTLFITAGMDIETKNPADDFTALHTAATYGHLSVVQYLAGQGATIDATGKNGETPLMWAAFNGHLSVMRYLLAQGASLLAKTTLGDRRAKTMAEEGGFPAVAQDLQVREEGRLRNAATRGDLAVVKECVAAGVAIESRGSSSGIPLHWAAYGGHLEVVRYLGQHNGDHRCAVGGVPGFSLWAGSVAAPSQFVASKSLRMQGATQFLSLGAV